jgi:uncharacterized protein (TIGR03067 family)
MYLSPAFLYHGESNRISLTRPFEECDDMRLLQALMLVLGAGLLLAAADQKEDAAKKDRDKLQGTWKVTSAERDGQPDPVSKDAVTTFTADGKLSVKFADGKTGQGTYKLDPTQKPPAMEYTLDYGPDKGKPLLGIYALEGNGLKICRSDAGKPRPKVFMTKPDSGRMLFVLRREKAPVTKAPPAPASPFPDKNLETAVRAALHEPTASLTDEKLGNLYFLEADGKGIRDLSGLEKCKNLALIKLTKNQIQEVKPLKDLTNLQSLDLSGNKITDAAPLAGLTKLQYLELSHNQIRDLTPLKGLTSLSALYLTGNKISDIAPLGSLGKLSSLSLGHNQIRDISTLTQVTRISTLELKDNQIEDLTPLTKQTEISLLMLDRNKITELTPLVTMAKADAEGAKRFAPFLRLYLTGNPLSEAAKTQQLAALKQFGVRIEY